MFWLLSWFALLGMDLIVFVTELYRPHHSEHPPCSSATPVGLKATMEALFARDKPLRRQKISEHSFLLSRIAHESPSSYQS